MFETEFQAKHRALAEKFSTVNVQAAVAHQRAAALAGVAARERDEARAAEYRAMADEWAAKAEKLQKEAHKLNAEITAHIDG